MKTRTRTVYVTEDGKEFHNKEDAIKYDINQKVARLCTSKNLEDLEDLGKELAADPYFLTNFAQMLSEHIEQPVTSVECVEEGEYACAYLGDLRIPEGLHVGGMELARTILANYYLIPKPKKD